MNKLVYITLLCVFSLTTQAQIQKIYLEDELGYFFPYQEALRAEALIRMGKNYPSLYNSYQTSRKVYVEKNQLLSSKNEELFNIIVESNEKFKKFGEIHNKSLTRINELEQEKKELRKSNRNKLFIIGGVIAMYLTHIIIISN